MPPRKPFLLRLDPALHDALQRWAAAELRSLNGQIEYLLREAAVGAGRLAAAPPGGADARERGDGPTAVES